MAHDLEANKQVVRRFWEVAHGKDLSKFPEVVTEDYIEHQDFGQGPGYEGLMQRFRWVYEAFPDFNVTVNDMIAEGDKVMCFYTDRGTFKGPWLGLQPTGNKFAMDGIHIFRLRDGRICEHWAVVDVMSLYAQMGVLLPVAQQLAQQANPQAGA